LEAAGALGPLGLTVGVVRGEHQLGNGKMTQLPDEASEPLPVRHACFASDVDRFLS
jgi:hypothetical protein